MTGDARAEPDAAAVQRRRRRRLGRASRRPGRSRHARTIGAAIHSVRSVDPPSMSVVAEWAAAHDAAAARPCQRAAGGERAVPSQCTVARPSSCSTVRACSAIGSPRCTPRTSPTTTSPCCSRATRRVASARRPNAISPMESARPQRSADAGIAMSHRHRFACGDRPVRGGAGDRARRAAGVAAPRHPSARRAADTSATRTGYRSLGWPDGGRIAVGALADFATGVVDLAATCRAPILMHAGSGGRVRGDRRRRAPCRRRRRGRRRRRRSPDDRRRRRARAARSTQVWS